MLVRKTTRKSSTSFAAWSVSWRAPGVRWNNRRSKSERQAIFCFPCRLFAVVASGDVGLVKRDSRIHSSIAGAGAAWSRIDCHRCRSIERWNRESFLQYGCLYGWQERGCLILRVSKQIRFLRVRSMLRGAAELKHPVCASLHRPSL